ncbi:MAG: TetR/AcrR family transcriptional regulator [Caulobacteraceae bacterium]
MQQASEGRQGQKARTRRDLLDTAVRLIQAGGRPTIEEVAEAAGVSRRTAYRYFRSQDHLLADAALEAVRPEMARIVEAVERPQDVEERVLTLVSAMHHGNRRYEPQLRAILAANLAEEEPAPGEPRRGHRRVEWVRQALRPLEGRLEPDAFETLVSSLCVIVGYDAYRLLREMRGLSHDEIEPVVRWMAVSLVRAAGGN